MKSFNPLLQNMVFKFCFVVLLAISYPLLILNIKLFLFTLGLLSYLIAFFLNLIFEKSLRELLKSLLLISWFRILLLITGTICMFFVFNNQINQFKNVAIIFVWLLPMICLWGVMEIIYEMFKLQKKINSTESNLFRILRFLLLLFVLIMTMVLPDFAFGYGYKLFFDILYNLRMESNFEGFYISFIINHTLPLTDKDLSKYISLINSDNYLRLYQTVQVYFNKLLELLFIAVIIKSLFGIVGEKITK